MLLGDSGTGKTHLLIGLGLAACEQGRKVRYITCAQLVNEVRSWAGRYGALCIRVHQSQLRSRTICRTFA